MAIKKKNQAAKARTKAADQMKSTLESMLATAESIVGAIQEALEHDDPDEIVALVEEFDIDSLEEEAKNIQTIEYPEDDSE